jgi:hypothetical protein
MMKRPTIELDMDYVRIDGQVTLRLTSISRLQWLQFWEQVLNQKDDYEAGYERGYDEGYDEGREDGYADGSEDAKVLYSHD